LERLDWAATPGATAIASTDGIVLSAIFMWCQRYQISSKRRRLVRAAMADGNAAFTKSRSALDLSRMLIISLIQQELENEEISNYRSVVDDCVFGHRAG
jgi:hypothetical protein